MGVDTPRFGIYKPATSETGYEAEFNNGMESIDQELRREAAGAELPGYAAITRDGTGLVTSIIRYANVGQTIKIGETTINRVGGLVTSVVVKDYNAAGSAVLKTYTTTITRNGSGQVTNVDTAVA